MSMWQEEIEDLDSRVRNLENAMAQVCQQLGIPFELPASDNQPIIDALQRNDKMGAISAYRQMHPCSLDQAMEAVEEIRVKNGL